MNRPALPDPMSRPETPLANVISAAPRSRARTAVVVMLLAAVSIVFVQSDPARAVGERTSVEMRILSYAGGNPSPRPSAVKRLMWEVRQRTSVETKLEAQRVRFSEPSVFEGP